MSSRDPMTELAVTMETLTSAVQNLTTKFDALRDDKVAGMVTEVAVISSKLDRLQNVVYGTLAAVGIEILGGLAALLLWLIKR